ncbi:ATP-binding cassette domain-containing protein [Nitrosomonas communis]|uniref:Osmoprotectant transport system ATP-binding protein n=1 Tax=Nitrosomonas communis TaxID=44574 RepID=A0A1H2ZLJ1_9PROT|nr:ATP-binding cassette domain-containing protein [Nitrosomonas communis]SDX18243.1 osmoprotectant transport system ATP-binding protein [Nitrosomonas communis]
MASDSPLVPSPALTADEVVKRYGSAIALDGVSLAVRAGECVALVGESGSGKSTLLRCFNRMTEPEGGRITVQGENVASLDAVRLRRQIGYVQQEGGLLPHWTVLRNVSLVPWLRGDTDAEARGTDALAWVGMDAARFGRRWPRELSGGQRQRVAVARALAARPKIVLLDEPFGALDAITRMDLQEAFSKLRRELEITAILVTHDLHEAALLADRIAVFRGGRIEQAASPDTLIHAPETEYVAGLVARSRLGAG